MGEKPLRQVIGVDIGGTGIKGLVVNEAGMVLAEMARATETCHGRKGILGQLNELLSELLAGCSEVEAIGLASAGRVNVTTGEVVYATDNLPGWQGMPLTQWAAETFGLPAAADNDANAALIGEAWLGAGRGKPSLVMLTLGTGVGGANMYEGRLLRGAGWRGGDWGHSVLVPGGRPCNCGKQGCVEQYVSGSALQRIALEQTKSTYTHGCEIMAAAGRGEATALVILEQYTADLALVIANISASMDPEWIILGGGVIHDHAIWWHRLTNKLHSEGLADRIVAAELGNRAGCFGAARLALDRLYRDGSTWPGGSDKGEKAHGY
ncbi:ROK family protein [Paenibacillus pabuli]|uniref:ROK family protein n=1 Tax=Paenibacillus pabuli TaxID=1472 RepID=UPI00083A1DD3|nr:ROK family protein [Paenibacillus pabuli]MEC0127816.1 ROK family protein [Paenibacillus pabuli]